MNRALLNKIDQALIFKNSKLRIEEKTLKYLISLIIFTLSFSCFSQTNRQRLEDIEDRLEMMQAEREYRDAQRMGNQSNLLQSPSSSETPLQLRLRVGGYSRILKNENVSIYIRDSSIENIGPKANPEISYQFIYEFSKPQYATNKSFFIIEGRGTIFCKQKSVLYSMGMTHGLDKNLKIVVPTIGMSSGGVANTLAEPIKNYLCP